jgi:ribonuclease P protein component
MNTRRTTFNKSERLCSTKIISGLFEDGKMFHTSLFKVVWNKSPVTLPFPAQVAFSVAKRGFKLAVTRNLIKRRMRESYRTNKYQLYETLSQVNKQIVFVVILKGGMVPDYKLIDKSVQEMLNRLIIMIREM